MASTPTGPRLGLGMRRVSIETISAPLSEPAGGASSVRSDDTDSKRRRITELKSIPEEKSETKVIGDEGPLHDPHATSSSSAAATAGSGVPPSGHVPLVLNPEVSGPVRTRVREIEQRPHMRRRSRPPLPEVLHDRGGILAEERLPLRFFTSGKI